MGNSKIAELSKGFSKLNKKERLNRLVQMGFLCEEDISLLTAERCMDTELAEKFIENVIGYFHLPLGVATNFRIDDRELSIPMAVEETSIIAAASKTARWIRDNGEITTKIIGSSNIGQIQFAEVKDFEQFEKVIQTHKKTLIEDANQNADKIIVGLGGGVKDIQVRRIHLENGVDMGVIHVLVDTCDAMGANTINQICEYLKEPLQALTGETVTMCILSNLNDTKITQAKVIIRDIEPELAEGIEGASLFANMDPYRAATNNKGVLNGIDAVLIATGNDWRAVEAGVHAYAARDGQYRSVTRWFVEDKNLVGILEAPIIVGTVGGVTKLHPTAKMCLKMLGVKTANELSRIIAAVGLVQNLGAIRALTTEGITAGHMRLHLPNLALSAGVSPEEMPIVVERLKEILKSGKRISVDDVKGIKS